MVVSEVILNSLVPIFFGMALGYVGGWTRDVDNKHVGNSTPSSWTLPSPRQFLPLSYNNRGMRC